MNLRDKHENQLPSYTVKGTKETFDHLSFHELRKEAKQRGISAGGSADAIRSRLNEIAVNTEDKKVLTRKARREMRRRRNSLERQKRAEWITLNRV
tara:strand:- start:298 stop:585 length:288 start_codon:yes stop_codon:yes gene_type:complete